MILSEAYCDVLESLCDHLQARPSPGPALRVAVDGRSGVGKTTFTRHLIQRLQDRSIAVVGVSVDGFHHPRARRYAHGRYSAEGYYKDARDLDAVIDLCLAPLGPGGSGRFAQASFDLERNEPIEPVWRQARPGQILIMEGTFLLRPELCSYWDAKVCLEASQEIARSRGMARDAHQLGDETEALYRQRYDGAYALYDAEAQPETQADWRIDMSDFHKPFFVGV